MYPVYPTRWKTPPFRSALAALAEQAALLNMAHDAIIVRDLDAKITFWNLGAVDTYKWTEVEALGRVVHELLQTKYPIPLRAIEAEVFNHEVWEGELEQTTRDGRRLVLASRWSLRRDESGAPNAILEINRDITERKHMEAQIEANKIQMVASARLSALGMMAGGIAHEINNPLGIIHELACDLLESVNENGAAPPEMVVRNSELVRDTAERIAPNRKRPAADFTGRLA
jgi:PAS domain S-box-containing protein